MITWRLMRLEICGVNASRLPVLTEDEKEFLFERIRKGDENPRRELYIKGNLRLVLSVIKRFGRSSSENVDDLVPDWLYRPDATSAFQIILRASLQVKFSTYAVPDDYR